MEGNSLTSYENLCKIFAMRIKLDNRKNVETPSLVFDNYEKYAKKVDAIYNEEFQKELRPLLSPEVTLEKEEERLKRLIKLLESRLEKRKNLETEFYDTTKRYLDGLQMIASDGELEDKKNRLSLISNYLETNSEMTSIEESISSLRDLLAKEEDKKHDYQDKHEHMEDELYTLFTSKIKDDEFDKDTSEDDIDAKLEEVRAKANEAKETLDITKESIQSLVANGLKEDYTSYVEEAERDYFAWKNREIVLKIYKLVINFEEDFKALYTKREKIVQLLEEKKSLRENLNVTSKDILSSFESLAQEQLSTLKDEKEVLDNIANYESRIKFKEERLEELKEANSSVETLALLREYGLIETYDHDSEEVIPDMQEDEEVNEKSEEVAPTLEYEQIFKEIYNPYRITAVKDYPKTLNIGLAKLKGESVREKVTKKLNPVKDLPKEMTIITSKEEKPKEDTHSDSPVWTIPSSSEPLKEDSVKPVTPPTSVTLASSETKEKTNSEEDNNMFWVPVSDAKLENNAFPSFNIPIEESKPQSELEKFVFPTINN